MMNANDTMTISAEDLATALEARRDDRLFGSGYANTYAGMLEPDVEFVEPKTRTAAELPEGAVEMAVEAEADFREESQCPDGRFMHRLGECGCPHVTVH